MKGKFIKKDLAVLISIVICITFFSSCAPIQLPELSSKPELVPQHQSREEEGLLITIDPFLDKKKVKQFFGVDLISKNIIPVLVHVENRSKKSNFYLLKEGCVLLTGSGTERSLDQPSAEQKGIRQEHIAVAASKAAVNGSLAWVTASEAAATKAWGAGGGAFPAASTASVATASVALVTLPVVLAWAEKKITDAQIIHQNMIEKQLQERTLSYGQSHRGFLYFKLQDGSSLEDTSKIELKVKDILTKKITNFAFKLRE